MLLRIGIPEIEQSPFRLRGYFSNIATNHQCFVNMKRCFDGINFLSTIPDRSKSYECGNNGNKASCYLIHCEVFLKRI